ncbi:3-hydroxyacyl-ACP dehydratase FabZ family protein [Paenibacillus sp. FSL L8-0436]|uniref:3-hydroxyacyl-ACP dehydratase FabZ family protein n=1 Tax=Paenibacillus sp. FSL L8-0436 TaxID=2954686 RepID=UPI0031581833
MEENITLNLMEQDEILKLIPHRSPFLFVDNIVGFTQEQIVCEKLFRGDEQFFIGHFPGNPIVPGVILIETLAQAAAVLNAIRWNKSQEGYLMKVNHFTFRKFVLPDQLLRIQVKHVRKISKSDVFSGEIYRNEQLVAEGSITVVMKED